MNRFYGASVGLLMMLVVGNVFAAEQLCAGISARFERIVAVDGSRWGVFSVRNEGASAIRFPLTGGSVESSRAELHPLSYNIHSQVPGSAEWLPDMTIGTFVPPEGAVDVKGGDSADLYLSVDQVFDGRFPPGTSFFVRFRPADLKCLVRSDEFLSPSPSHMGLK